MDISSKRVEFDRVNQVTFIVNRWKKSTQRDLLPKIDNRGILPPVKRIERYRARFVFPRFSFWISLEFKAIEILF